LHACHFQTFLSYQLYGTVSLLECIPQCFQQFWAGKSSGVKKKELRKNFKIVLFFELEYFGGSGRFPIGDFTKIDKVNRKSGTIVLDNKFFDKKESEAQENGDSQTKRAVS
jgi:hypothetical protein